jgi:tRNA nucleotidyltransferase/poly(A) polymerase
LIPDALDYLDAVSGERISHEIELLWREPAPEAVLAGFDAYGLLDQITLHFEQWQANAMLTVRGFRAQTQWENFPVDRETVYWIILACDHPDLVAIVDRLHLTKALATQLDEGRRAYLAIPELRYALMPSEVAALLDGLSYNALMAAWAIAGWTSPARDLLIRYATEWRDVKPTLRGDDLIRMGLPAGPKIGRLLNQLRDAWLDNEITSTEEEVRYVEDWINEEKSGDDH